MAASLDEIRKRLKAQEEKKGGTTFQSDNASYPFWNIPENSTAVLRFLPDGDEENAYFWKERAVIKLPFPGIKGQGDKPVIVQVPCMHTWNESCPITEEIKPWWKDDDLKDTARIYYKKVSYLYQGFVVTSPLVEEKAPETPIRRFIVNKELHNMIAASLMDPDMEALPCDYNNGADFKVVKTKKGQYASYDTSGFSRKNRTISDEERAAIEEHGLHNLSEFLPKKPDAEHLEAIKQMFAASVDGLPYDMEKWGKFYKPQGFQSNATDTEEKTTTKATVAAKVTKAVVEEDEDEVVAPVSKTTDTSGKKDPKDLLAELRRRQSSKE